MEIDRIKIGNKLLNEESRDPLKKKRGNEMIKELINW